MNDRLATLDYAKPLQEMDELAAFADLLVRRGVRSYLEIGARYGGSFEHVMMSLPPGSLGVAVDFPGGAFGDSSSAEILMAAAARIRAAGRRAEVIFGPSAAPEVVARASARGPYDAVLVDADHSYAAARGDYGTYQKMSTGLVALHDVAAPDDHKSRAGLPVEVGRLWREIKSDHPARVTSEIVAPGSVMGFGVVDVGARSPGGRLCLPDVTLFIGDAGTPELAALALRDTLALIKPARVITASPGRLPVEVGTRATHVEVPPWRDAVEFQKFLWRELPRLVTTSHVLIIQWDGWVVDASMWTDRFLQYDYVGAPWWYEDLNVGNGCGLRSARLMRYLADHAAEFPLPSQEDDVLCRRYRPVLEDHGFRWAPEALASRFAVECTRPAPGSRHFMFHDAFNFPEFLSPSALSERLVLMDQVPRLASKRQEIRIGRVPHVLPRLA